MGARGADARRGHPLAAEIWERVPHAPPPELLFGTRAPAATILQRIAHAWEEFRVSSYSGAQPQARAFALRAAAGLVDVASAYVQVTECGRHRTYFCMPDIECARKIVADVAHFQEVYEILETGKPVCVYVDVEWKSAHPPGSAGAPPFASVLSTVIACVRAEVLRAGALACEPLVFDASGAISHALFKYSAHIVFQVTGGLGPPTPSPPISAEDSGGLGAEPSWAESPKRTHADCDGGGGEEDEPAAKRVHHSGLPVFCASAADVGALVRGALMKYAHACGGAQMVHGRNSAIVRDGVQNGMPVWYDAEARAVVSAVDFGVYTRNRAFRAVCCTKAAADRLVPRVKVYVERLEQVGYASRAISAEIARGEAGAVTAEQAHELAALVMCAHAHAAAPRVAAPTLWEHVPSVGAPRDAGTPLAACARAARAFAEEVHAEWLGEAAFVAHALAAERETPLSGGALAQCVCALFVSMTPTNHAVGAPRVGLLRAREISGARAMMTSASPFSAACGAVLFGLARAPRALGTAIATLVPGGLRPPIPWGLRAVRRLGIGISTAPAGELDGADEVPAAAVAEPPSVFLGALPHTESPAVLALTRVAQDIVGRVVAGGAADVRTAMVFWGTAAHKPLPSILVTTRSRVCRLAGREHRSNNVYYIVKWGCCGAQLMQRCHDPVCEGSVHIAPLHIGGCGTPAENARTACTAVRAYARHYERSAAARTLPRWAVEHVARTARALLDSLEQLQCMCSINEPDAGEWLAYVDAQLTLYDPQTISTLMATLRAARTASRRAARLPTWYTHRTSVEACAVAVCAVELLFTCAHGTNVSHSDAYVEWTYGVPTLLSMYCGVAADTYSFGCAHSSVTLPIPT